MTGDDRELDAFLAEVLPIIRAMDTAFHNGDPAPRAAAWSHRDPVTVFGALRNVSGWDQIEPVFEALASRFSNGSFEYEVLAAGVSGDLGYLAGMEHTIASVESGEPTEYHLRVTTILRREDGRWKIVHRHADAMPGSDRTAAHLGRLANALERPQS